SRLTLRVRRAALGALDWTDTSATALARSRPSRRGWCADASARALKDRPALLTGAKDENAVSASTAESSGQIVIAGAGYAGLHVALRLTAKLRNHPEVELALVDRHDYHQVITELPRVAGGTRAADAVRIPLQDMLAERVRFVQTEITGFDLAGRRLLTG